MAPNKFLNPAAQKLNAIFLLSIGVTLPPLCAVSYQGEYKRATKASLAKKFRKEKQTANGAETMARNLAFFAQASQGEQHPGKRGLEALLKSDPFHQLIKPRIAS